MDMKTSGFLECDHFVLDHILTNEYLHDVESEIFKACLNWARRKCEKNEMDPYEVRNLRLYLKQSVYKIRYGSMTMAEFEKHIPRTKLTTLFPDPDDHADVVQLLKGHKVSKTGRFFVQPRFLHRLYPSGKSMAQVKEKMLTYYQRENMIALVNKFKALSI